VIRHGQVRGRKRIKQLKLEGLERSERELLTEIWVIQSLLDLPITVAQRKCMGLKQHYANYYRCRHSCWAGTEVNKNSRSKKDIFLIHCKNYSWPFSHLP